MARGATSLFVVFVVVIYFQGFGIVLPVIPEDACGQQVEYPVELLPMPITLHSTLQPLF